MILAVDRIIPYAADALGPLGELRFYAAEKLRPADLRDVDAMVVRTVTRADAGLLEGSSVRFVGTASIGMDHLDLEYLRSRDIRYANAAGCNANAVAEYVTASLLVLAVRRGWNLSAKSIAVIGVGNVGSRVAEKARGLGMKVLKCDPPLRDATGDARYRRLEDVLDADILTLHVPLTASGPYPTRGMVGRELLSRLRKDQFVMNSSRGAVVDGAALKEALRAGRIAGAALDVWEKEPRIDHELLDLVDIATAHIAGYSLDGKVRGTGMMFEELCRFFGLDLSWNTDYIFPPQGEIRAGQGSNLQDKLADIVPKAYNVLEDDARLRAVRALEPAAAANEFNNLRNYYAYRPEFRHYTVTGTEADATLTGVLSGLGFGVAARQPVAGEQ
jgi:erythronate-4-phosphate dehydrogenase